MKKSENEKVQQFLDAIMTVDEDQYRILQKLRGVVNKIHPMTKEKMMYGGIMFSLTEDYAGIFARKNHVSFEFGDGFKMNDPYNLLEGKGKYRRHLKIKSLTEIEDKKVEFFVRQAV